jgi:hypothetical protein
MVDRVLAAAGAMAFAADRAANWVVKRPDALISLIAVWIILATRIWELILLLPFALLLTVGRSQLRNSRAKRARSRLGLYDPPPPGDLRNGAMATVAAVLVLAIVVPWPSNPITPIVISILALFAAAVLLGWRLDYLVFRPDPEQGNEMSVPLPPGESCTAKASGRLLTHDMVFEVTANNRPTPHVALVRAAPEEHVPVLFRLAPVKVLNAPTGSAAPAYGRAPRDSQLLLIGTERELGLSMSTPDLLAAETGTLKLVRSDRPAIRLDTVAGPLVLSFDTPVERAQIARAIREALA